MAVNVSTNYASRILSGSSDTFASIFQDGCMEIRTGPQPAGANAAVTGSLIARIRRDGVPWVAGSPDGGLRFIVSDTGPGVDPEVRQHIFEPFYTTKGVGNGTGLGLAVAYSLVKRHGGRIEVDNPETGGAAFTVRLPAGETAAPAAKEGPS